MLVGLVTRTNNRVWKMPTVYVLLIVGVAAAAGYIAYFAWRDSRANEARLEARRGPKTHTPPAEPAKSPKRAELPAVDYQAPRGGDGSVKK